MNTDEGTPMTTATPPKARTLDDECNSQRAACKAIEKELRALKDKITRDRITRDRRGNEDSFPGQTAEILGQLTLAFRHLEDARMRIGKVIQYSGDGISCFDK